MQLQTGYFIGALRCGDPASAGAAITAGERDAAAKTEVDRILRTSITDPAGPEFMAPPPRSDAGTMAAAE